MHASPTIFIQRRKHCILVGVHLSTARPNAPINNNFSTLEMASPVGLLWSIDNDSNKFIFDRG